MVALNTRFQIASICFFIVFLTTYRRYKRLPILSAKIYKWMCMFIMLNLVFDVTTVYTVNNLDWVNPLFNRVCHQIFIGSLDTVIVLFYVYVTVLVHKQKRPHGLHMVLIAMPYVISIFMVFFGSLYYYQGKNGNYSYGPMANTVYVSAAFYVIMIVVNTFRYSDDMLSRRRKTAVHVSLVLWVCAALVQLLRHDILVSGMAEVMMMYYIYYAFENPKETMEENVGCRNKAAYHTMVEEYLATGKPFIQLDVVIEDLLMIYHQYGHDAGHMYMEELVTRIQGVSGLEVFRAKSDTLALFLTHETQTQIDSIIEGLQNRLTVQVQYNNNSISRKMHIDLIEIPQYADNLDSLCNIVEYMAEYRSQKNLEVVRVDDRISAQNRRNLLIEELLHTAIEKDGFEMFYQPIYHPKTHNFASAEALLRLKDTETIGFISPEEFIPIAEKKGMIAQIGNIVFEKVCSFISANQLQELGVEYIEVNLSGIQCQDKQLPYKMKRIMDHYQVTPQMIDFEITETAAVDAGDVLYRNMREMKEYGSTFAMDDFGTGYSNLAQMVEIAYEFVKLDKSLVWPAFDEQNEKAVILLEEVITMVQHLGIGIIAEGVETKEQAQWLIEHDVAHLQGYYYSRPIPGDKYLEFIHIK